MADYLAVSAGAGGAIPHFLPTDPASQPPSGPPPNPWATQERQPPPAALPSQQQPPPDPGQQQQAPQQYPGQQPPQQFPPSPYSNGPQQGPPYSSSMPPPYPEPQPQPQQQVPPQQQQQQQTQPYPGSFPQQENPPPSFSQQSPPQQQTPPRGPIQQQLQPPQRYGQPQTRYPPKSVRRGPHAVPQQGRPPQPSSAAAAGRARRYPPNKVSPQPKMPIPGLGQQEQKNMTFAGKDLRNLDKDAVFEGLKKLYEKKVKPLEVSSKYAMFRSPTMTPSDFTAKPMVLIVGQYSVGKTSFIRSLVGKDFPGQRVGPEPTTDRFTAIMHGDESKLLPGHVLVNSKEYPFMGLDSFGNNFLSKMEGAVVDGDLLRNVTLIDTPGVPQDKKQRIGRDYDFASVISWFAERADMIIIMFDAHKLDISDELKSVIDTLRPHQDKMRILLNKADTIDTQQLMRVYGALMWSLGKVMMTPEVFRVYMGSFWDGELKQTEQAALLMREKMDLINELMSLPDNAVLRRINELVKRARSVKVHAYIIHYLRKQMPYMYNKKEKQQKLISRLPQQFKEAAARYELPVGDFPNVRLYQERLKDVKDISKFQKLDKSLIYEMEKVFTSDIPKLLEKCTISSSPDY
eukprot:CAMPEP_0117751234 /NCGR_PEP_ID=MMETSP0947-20121206/10850_1 /TAXON_ID=44440 /ORGANISM="Chattonella subsalsa, Strain CCMP2191" /LENGTH=628 /DNA_ID=CAMNT_0005569569 /DNA_START=245 /DNA_END=2133 /DNA_ORIENTATION=+